MLPEVVGQPPVTDVDRLIREIAQFDGIHLGKVGVGQHFVDDHGALEIRAVAGSG